MIAREMLGSGINANAAQGITGFGVTIAAAGSTQATAAQLLSSTSIVTGADGTKGVQLLSGIPGDEQWIFNNSASVLNVYPPAGAAISVVGTGLGSTNAAYSQSAFWPALYKCQSSTQWIALPGMTLDSPTFTGTVTVSTLDVTGLADISAAGAGQIKFPATQNASSNANTLDDYEESTWTPSLSFITPGDLAVTYTTIRNGFATKVGRIVTLDYSVQTSAFTYTTSAGDLIVTGIPYPAQTSAGYGASGTPWWGGLTLTAGYTQLIAAIISGESQIRFVMAGSTKTATDAGVANAPTTSALLIRGSITYIAA